MGNLVFVNHFVLFHFLDSDNLSAFPVTANSDFAESTTTDDFERLEVFDCNLGTPVANGLS